MSDLGGRLATSERPSLRHPYRSPASPESSGSLYTTRLGRRCLGISRRVVTLSALVTENVTKQYPTLTIESL